MLQIFILLMIFNFKKVLKLNNDKIDYIKNKLNKYKSYKKL